MGDYGVGALVNAGLGLILGNQNDKRQLKQQGKLQEQQIQGQMKMTDYNQEKALEMWEATNYKAQMEQMQKAGLNVGLMYGGGGAGGTTANVTSGNVQGANAPQGGKEVQEGMALGLQQAMTQAQTELLKSQTAKTEAEKTEIEARTPTHAKGIEKTDAEIKEIASKMGINEETVRNIITQENKNIAETNKITTLTPLEAKQLKAQTGKTEQETKLTTENTIAKQIENKFAGTINELTLQKITSEIAKIQADRHITNTRQRNEEIIAVLKELQLQKEVTSEQAESIIQTILKLF